MGQIGRGQVSTFWWWYNPDGFMVSGSRIRRIPPKFVVKDRSVTKQDKGRKTIGKEIHRLRKAKLGQNELDKHMFQEKLTFLTASKVEVVPPCLNLEADNLICNSRSSTLKHVDHQSMPSQASMIQSMVLVSG